MKQAYTLATALPIALLLIGSPAAPEGKKDRARQAIAEASAKVETINKLGGDADAPRAQAEAQAALRSARDHLAGGKKDEAIADAHHASEIADLAIAQAQRRRAENEQSQRAQADATAAQAQQAAAAANARADSAEQAAASAAADAAAARAAPPPAPVVIAQPAPTTTVTTETVKQSSAGTTARRPVKRVVHTTSRTARPVTSEKTTTTVTTAPQ